MSTQTHQSSATESGFLSDLGIDVAEPKSGKVVARMDLAPTHLEGSGRVDESVIGALARAANGAGANLHLEGDRVLLALDGLVRYFGAGAGDVLSAEARAVHADDEIVTWRTSVFRSVKGRVPVPDQRIAEISQTYRLVSQATTDAGGADNGDTKSGDVIEITEFGSAPPGAAASVPEQRRHQIFKGACDVIIRKGYADASIREIAAAADLSIPALYQYVKSKEDILFMITSGCMEEIFRTFRDGLRAEGGAIEKMQAAVASYVRYIGKNRKYINLVYRETRSLSPGNREKIFAIERDFMVLWEEIIRSGNETGEFRVENTDLAANLAYFMCSAWALRHWNIGRYSEDEVCDLLTRFILNGLVADGPKT